MRLALFGVLIALLPGCHSRDPHAVIADLLRDLDHRDADAAFERMVSPEQLASLFDCPSTAKDSGWLHPDERRRRLEKAREKWLRGGVSRVRLGDLFEEYDRKGQWASYRAGDSLAGCRVKAPFSREVYRVVLVITGGVIHDVQSTKPVEVWRIGGRPFVWDDPLDSESWD